MNQTHDLRIRSSVTLPTELQGRTEKVGDDFVSRLVTADGKRANSGYEIDVSLFSLIFSSKNKHC